MRSLVDCVTNKGCQRKSPNIEVPLSKQSLGLEGDSGERHPHASHYPIWTVTSYINQPSNAFAGTRNLILFLISVIRKWTKIERRLDRGISFFANNHLDAVFLRPVANHVDQAVAGNVHKFSLSTVPRLSFCIQPSS